MARCSRGAPHRRSCSGCLGHRRDRRGTLSGPPSRVPLWSEGGGSSQPSIASLRGDFRQLVDLRFCDGIRRSRSKLQDSSHRQPAMIDVICRSADGSLARYLVPDGAEADTAAGRSTIRTTRKPKVSLRIVIEFSVRDALRQLSPLLSQSPPRMTRRSPDFGPDGSRSGLFEYQSRS